MLHKLKAQSNGFVARPSYSSASELLDIGLFVSLFSSKLYGCAHKQLFGVLTYTISFAQSHLDCTEIADGRLSVLFQESGVLYQEEVLKVLQVC